jgi:hypothetical protein
MKFVEFQDAEGRTFTCEAGSSPATPGMNWWWVRITGENQRYAAFQTLSNDTAANLRPRILQYYAELLEGRARPREIRTGWGRKPAVKPATGESEVKATS